MIRRAVARASRTADPSNARSSFLRARHIDLLRARDGQSNEAREKPRGIALAKAILADPTSQLGAYGDNP